MLPRPPGTSPTNRARNSTDWTTKSPGPLPPVDDRTRGLAIAGFPYGEPLHLGAIAGNLPAAKPTGATPALDAAAKPAAP